MEASLVDPPAHRALVGAFAAEAQGGQPAVLASRTWDIGMTQFFCSF